MTAHRGKRCTRNVRGTIPLNLRTTKRGVCHILFTGEEVRDGGQTLA